MKKIDDMDEKDLIIDNFLILQDETERKDNKRAD